MQLCIQQVECRCSCKADRSACKADEYFCKEDIYSCKTNSYSCKADNYQCQADKKFCKADKYAYKANKHFTFHFLFGRNYLLSVLHAKGAVSCKRINTTACPADACKACRSIF